MCSAGHGSRDSITVAQSWVDFRTAINEKKEWHRTKRAQKINSRAETQNKKKGQPARLKITGFQRALQIRGEM